jgi:hypothetical protein
MTWRSGNQLGRRSRILRVYDRSKTCRSRRNHGPPEGGSTVDRVREQTTLSKEASNESVTQ